MVEIGPWRTTPAVSRETAETGKLSCDERALRPPIDARVGMAAEAWRRLWASGGGEGWRSGSDCAVDAFAEEVGVAVVAGVLVD
jgi:hypothetical protein